MSQMSPMEPSDQDGNAVADYRRQSREFLAKGRECLTDGDWHQAAEKGWRAAAWMAKAVAEAQGWEYRKHDQYYTVMRHAQEMSGDARLRNLRRAADELHGYFYTRKRFLDPDDIGQGLDEMELLLDILEPLTNPEPNLD